MISKLVCQCVMWTLTDLTPVSTDQIMMIIKNWALTTAGAILVECHRCCRPSLEESRLARFRHITFLIVGNQRTMVTSPSHEVVRRQWLWPSSQFQQIRRFTLWIGQHELWDVILIEARWLNLQSVSPTVPFSGMTLQPVAPRPRSNLSSSSTRSLLDGTLSQRWSHRHCIFERLLTNLLRWTGIILSQRPTSASSRFRQRSGRSYLN